MSRPSLLLFTCVGGLAWLLNAYFIKVKSWQSAARVSAVAKSWLSTLFFALTITFEILAVEASLPWHLFLWYLAYVSLALALFFSALSTAYQNFLVVRHWTTLLLAACLSLLTLFYVFFVSRITWVPDHMVPKTAPVLGFMLVLYLYSLVMGGVPIKTHLRDLTAETALPTRTRYVMLITARVAGVAYFLTKIAIALEGYLLPAHAGAPFLTVFHNFTLGFAGVIWVGVFLPNRVLVPLSAPFNFLGKLCALRNLRRIPARYGEFCPDRSPIAVVNAPASRWDAWRNLNFFLYRELIHVLDIKHNLPGVLRALEAQSGQPGPVADARRLNRILQAVEDGRDYWQMVRAYARVGRQVGRW